MIKGPPKIGSNMMVDERNDERFQDGSAVVLELQGEVYLTVTPPRWVGAPADIEEVLQKIRKTKIANINEQIVKEVVDACLGVPVRITGDLDTIEFDSLRNKGDGDGFAWLISKKDGLYISVHPPKGKGKRLEYEDVEKYFKGNEIIDVNYDMIKKVVNTATRVPVTVKLLGKSRKALEELFKDDIEISVSEDNMEARIILHSTMKNEIHVDLPIILNELEKRGVVYGIDKQKIEKLLQGKGVDKQVVIARGDRDIPYTFEIPAKGEPQIVQDKKADYYLRGQLPLVKKDQILVDRKRNVKGEVVRSRFSFDLKSIQGKNTLISGSGRELRAAISGYVYLLDGRVHVEREYMVSKGNVDPSMGDIHFEGGIFIGGSVLPGSKVEAVGNIEVSAGVRDAKITSKEGSVKIRFSESSIIHAKENILIEKDVMDSTLIAYGRVSVEGENGIVGGRITAGVEIKAVNVGLSDARLTELFIIHPQAYERDRELLDLEEKIKDLKEMLVSLGRKLNVEKEKDLLFKEMSRYFSLKREVDASISRKESLENTVIPEPKEWRIEVSGTVYPSVYIYIGDMKIERNEGLNKVISYDDNGQISISVLSIKNWL